MKVKFHRDGGVLYAHWNPENGLDPGFSFELKTHADGSMRWVNCNIWRKAHPSAEGDVIKAYIAYVERKVLEAIVE